MIEIDCFFSFGVGAGFAAFAGDLLRHLPWDTNQYFMYTLLYQSLIFAPSGIYLLWAYPGWETMFLFTTKDEMRPIIPTIFCFSNVFLAVCGFYLSHSFIKVGRPAQAHSVWAYSYIAMFTVMGFGYRRFLFAGNGDEWSQDQQTEYYAPLNEVIFDFLFSNILKTLVAMGAIMLPALYGPQLKWFWRSGKRYADQMLLWQDFVANWTFGISLGTLGYLIYMFLLLDSVGRNHFVDGTFGYFTPLVAFYVAQFANLFMFSFILLVPHPPSN